MNFVRRYMNIWNIISLELDSKGSKAFYDNNIEHLLIISDFLWEQMTDKERKLTASLASETRKDKNEG